MVAVSRTVMYGGLGRRRPRPARPAHRPPGVARARRRSRRRTASRPTARRARGAVAVVGPQVRRSPGHGPGQERCGTHAAQEPWPGGRRSCSASRPPDPRCKPAEWLLHPRIAGRPRRSGRTVPGWRQLHPHGPGSLRGLSAAEAVAAPQGEEAPEGVQPGPRRHPAADGRQPVGRSLAGPVRRHRGARGPGADRRRVQARAHRDPPGRPARGRARRGRRADGQQGLRLGGHGHPDPARGGRQPVGAAQQRRRDPARA